MNQNNPDCGILLYSMINYTPKNNYLRQLVMSFSLSCFLGRLSSSSLPSDSLSALDDDGVALLQEQRQRRGFAAQHFAHRQTACSRHAASAIKHNIVPWDTMCWTCCPLCCFTNPRINIQDKAILHWEFHLTVLKFIMNVYRFNFSIFSFFLFFFISPISLAHFWHTIILIQIPSKLFF